MDHLEENAEKLVKQFSFLQSPSEDKRIVTKHAVLHAWVLGNLRRLSVLSTTSPGWKNYLAG